MNWLQIWLLTPALLLLGISTHEVVLRQAKHEPSINDNADLFCDVYSQVQELEPDDVILLGASRMQTGFDLKVFHNKFPRRKSILLAQSGRGSSYPVFEEIVKKSDFKGIVIIEETEDTLMSRKYKGQKYTQKEFVDYCNRQFTLNQQVNHRISALLESQFVFVKNEGSPLRRLWVNLLSQRQLPEQFYFKTILSREQLIDYDRADILSLEEFRDRVMEEVKEKAQQSVMSPEEWLGKTEHWWSTVNQFRARGGRVIFVRMPVSQERWKFESQIAPTENYWNRFVDKLNVKSIHFADYPDLSNFNLPDTSHMDMGDKPVFTRLLLTHLENELQ